jgi:hypothetical protein
MNRPKTLLAFILCFGSILSFGLPQAPQSASGSATGLPGRISPNQLADILHSAEISREGLSPSLSAESGLLVQSLKQYATWSAAVNAEKVRALLKRLKGKSEAQTAAQASDILNVYLEGCSYQGGDIIIPGIGNTQAFIERYKFELSNPTGIIAARDAVVWGIKRTESDLDNGEFADALITYEALRVGSEAVMSIRDRRDNLNETRNGHKAVDAGYFEYFTGQTNNMTARDLPFLNAYMEATSGMYPALVKSGHASFGKQAGAPASIAPSGRTARRLTAAELKTVYDAAGTMSTALAETPLQNCRPLAKALQVCRGTGRSGSNQQMLTELLSDLHAYERTAGKTMEPRSLEDCAAAANMFQRCWKYYTLYYFADIRVLGAPADQGSACTQSLAAVADLPPAISVAVSGIRKSEELLDQNDLPAALDLLTALRTGTAATANKLNLRTREDADYQPSRLPFLADYLDRTGLVYDDLQMWTRARQTFIQLKNDHSLPGMFVAVAVTVKIEHQYASLSLYTLPYVKAEQRELSESLSNQIDSLAEYRFEEQQYVAPNEPTKANYDSVERARVALQNLVSRLGDQLSSWSPVTSVALTSEAFTLAKGQLTAAQIEKLSRLQSELAKASKRHDELSKQSDIINREASELRALPANIVNSALMVAMLEEKYMTTSVVGYRLEAETRRQDLFRVVRTNRAALTPSAWTDTETEFRRILPGLTESQAARTQSVISSARSAN